MTKIEMKSKGAALRSSEKKHRRLFSAAVVLLICCLAFVGAAGAAEYVAEIESKGFTSIQEAINDVADGGTATIRVTASHNLDCVNIDQDRDVSKGDVLILVDGNKDITIDLNGHTVTADYSGEKWGSGGKICSVIGVASGAKLTLTDGSNGNGTLHVNTPEENQDTEKVTYMLINDNTYRENIYSLIIEGGNYIFEHAHYGSGSSCMVYSVDDETILVKGGNFRLGNLGTMPSGNGAPWIFNAAGQNTKNIIVTGGTFNADIVHQYYPFEVSVPKEKALVKNPNDNTWTMVDAVAYVNEQEYSGGWYTNKVGYATLKEALEHAGPAKIESGATSSIEDVHLLTDYTVEETLNIDKDVTINLDGHTILWKGGVDNPIFTVDEEETLTITSFKIGNDFKIECVGYEIGGWYTKNAEGNDVSLEDNNGVVLTSLYAKEPRPIDYTITVTPTTGGSVGASCSNAHYGDVITLTSTPNTGYNFKELEVITDKGESVDVDENNSFSMPADNVTVTAKFVPLQYTVTFNTDGGTSTLTELRVTYDSPYANLPNAEKEGHTFLYWKHDDGTEVTNETVVNTARDHTLTAVWEEIITPSTSGGSSGEGGYLSFPRTTVNGGLVDFGSSKVVKALMLPEGSSGSVVLKVDTIEKWPKELETEYTFDISVEKLGEGMAYIHFEIPESTLESLGITPADICAYHLVNGEWVKLETTYEVKDGTVFYEAETDSFSPFKLVIEEGAAEPKAEETEPVIPPTEEPEDKPQEELPPIEPPVQPTEPESPSPILAVLAGLGAAAVLRRK